VEAVTRPAIDPRRPLIKSPASQSSKQLHDEEPVGKGEYAYQQNDERIRVPGGDLRACQEGEANDGEKYRDG
jgi:hypothetical protein